MPAASGVASATIDNAAIGALRLGAVHRDGEPSGRQERLVQSLREAGLYASDESGLSCTWLGDMPAPATPSRGRTAQLVLKRLIDITASLAALFVLMPLFAAVAAMIKATDAGPVFFRQQRVGKDGRAFTIYKFRSMYADRCDHGGVEQTVAGDERVMPVGEFLRRTSIDELPQLINILKGDMSLVGPRPHVAGQRVGALTYEQAVPYYRAREAMRPGLTGWAQANSHRGPTTDPVKARGRIDHDVAYIQNFSILLDLRVIARTLQREFFGGGTGF